MKPERSKLFLFLLVLLYVPAAWFVIFVPVAKVRTFFANLPDLVNTNFISHFPQTMEIKVTNGVVSLNQETPHCFLISGNTGVVIDPSAKPDLSVLSTTAAGPYSKLCQPIALIGSNFILYPDKNNSYKIQQIPTDANLTINHTSLVTFVNQNLPKLISIAQKAYYILPFIGLIFIYLFLLFINLWYTLMVRLALKISQKPLPLFGQTYNLSLFFYSFILFFDWFFLGTLNYFLKTSLDFSFLFRNTLVICAASLFYYKSHPSNSTLPPTPLQS